MNKLLLSLAIWTGRRGWRKTQRLLVRVKLFLQGYYPHTRMKILFLINSVAIALNVMVMLVQPSLATLVILLMVIATWGSCHRTLKREQELKKETEELKNLFPINNTSCKYYHHRDWVGECAVNPYGPCKECQDFEPIPKAIKK